MLWQWYRLAAVAPIGPLAWEPPYAKGVALKSKKKKKKKRYIYAVQYYSAIKKNEIMQQHGWTYRLSY